MYVSSALPPPALLCSKGLGIDISVYQEAPPWPGALHAGRAGLEESQDASPTGLPSALLGTPYRKRGQACWEAWPDPLH